MTAARHPDHALVAAAQRGDAPAIAWLGEQLLLVPRFVKRLAVRRGLSARADLDDVASRAVTVALGRLRLYHGLAPLAAWLHRICELTLLGQLRRQRRELVAEGEEQASNDRTPSSAAELAETRTRIAAAIDRVGGAEAEILRRRWLLGEDFPDIAAAAGIPLATVRTRYYRGMARLRQLLSPADP
jgi:RNA polymerase sigma-70 factor (ECF subfamily)